MFAKVLLELSNETWNWIFGPWTFGGNKMIDSVTGKVFTSGQVYGLWQEYVSGVLRQSPHWTPYVASKVGA
jgi:hypothetical protein